VLEIEQKDKGLPPVSLPELQLKQILVPVDFSEGSRKALHYAILLARQFNAEITILHVMPVVPAGVSVWGNAKLEAAQHEAVAKELSEWRNAALGPTVKAVIRNGMSAPQEIIGAADEANADLIIVGSHGRTGLARALLGSTAERIVRRAPCPVLVVRAREHDFLAEE
jgi:nucleotide-binding universal stress UspA family protein